METFLAAVNRIRERLSDGYEEWLGKERSAFEPDRERLVEIALAFLLAFFLWFWVKMGREYTVNMPVSVSVQTLPENETLMDPLPETVQASTSGEGWELLSWSLNPQSVRLEIFNERVDLTEQVRQQVTSLYDVTLHGVEPAELTVNLEPVVEITLPVTGAPDIRYRPGYGPLGPLTLEPDSVRLRGGESKMAGFESWPLPPVELANIAADLRREIPLSTPPEGIELEPDRVRVTQQVTQYTQGERTLEVEGEGFPPGMFVQFIPSSITVRFLIPIETYSEAERLELFRAVVAYDDMRVDESGFVTPRILPAHPELPIRIQSVSPPSVAYYELLE